MSEKRTAGQCKTALVKDLEWEPLVINYSKVGRQIRFILMDAETWVSAADLCAAIGISNSDTIVRKCDKRDVAKLPYSKATAKAFTDAGSKTTMYCALGIRFVTEHGMRTILEHIDSPLSELFEQWYNETAKPEIQKRLNAIPQDEEPLNDEPLGNNAPEDESQKWNQPENMDLFVMSQDKSVMVNIGKMEFVETVGRNIIAHYDAQHDPIFLGTYSSEEDARMVHNWIFNALSDGKMLYEMPPERTLHQLFDDALSAREVCSGERM